MIWKRSQHLSNLQRALEWIDQYGDINQDGFVEYVKSGKAVWITRGGKTRDSSLFRRELANPPIALCEVQGMCTMQSQRCRYGRSAG